MWNCGRSNQFFLFSLFQEYFMWKIAGANTTLSLKPNHFGFIMWQYSNVFDFDDDGNELFSGMLDQGKALRLISSRNHCWGFSTMHTFDTLQARFKPVQNLSSRFVEWSCAVGITTTTHAVVWILSNNISMKLTLRERF